MNLVNKYVLLLCATVFLTVGCVSTVTPVQVVSTGASFDNGERNSGFIGWTTNSSVTYGIISQHARDRYNSLIDIYGNKIIPPIKKDYGITDNKTNCLITLEALSNFAKMNRWRKNGQ
jgi:hypothetical protein